MKSKSGHGELRKIVDNQESINESPEIVKNQDSPSSMAARNRQLRIRRQIYSQFSLKKFLIFMKMSLKIDMILIKKVYDLIKNLCLMCEIFHFISFLHVERLVLNKQWQFHYGIH